MAFTPLPLVDDFLLSYHVGHALLVLFALSIVGTIPLGSRKLVALNASLFGVLFFVSPASQLGSDPFTYRMLGVALLVVAPILYTTARE
ncbi:hypothetical protein [Halobacterium sp. CBA1126]|uniref:hypothetical protein n=1 Tax=Halobacterium TaxID=2239 RepID=UPI0012F7AE50|nr:hypothetical protein [Halobacterium sp. CBA1126]MUV61636.1 hypothetical protein [Halobacterium sp. CBA1126]